MHARLRPDIRTTSFELLAPPGETSAKYSNHALYKQLKRAYNLGPIFRKQNTES